MPKQVVKDMEIEKMRMPSKLKTLFDKIVHVPSRGKKPKEFLWSSKETDMPHGKLLIHMEKTAVIM